MYYCENCFKSFYEPLIIQESYGLPGPWKQRFAGCPYCRTTGMIGVMENDTV